MPNGLPAVTFVHASSEKWKKVLSGTLIRTLSKSGPDRFLEWDLQTETALPIASGMYLIHVDVLDSDGKSIGEKIIKFGVVKKRIQLDLL